MCVSVITDDVTRERTPSLTLHTMAISNMIRRTVHTNGFSVETALIYEKPFDGTVSKDSEADPVKTRQSHSFGLLFAI